ncbi:MAG TPA: class II aldolase/adducin family protein [Pseudolabrys sp.]|nr:class II aldolase/adducin family protein [Pseudolabrys sp.]
MADPLTEARRMLALANKIAANEGVLDTFGHVSMRHPGNPNRYFLSRSSAPDMVTAEGLIEYDLDSEPVRDPGVPQYSERVIHGEIYKARPDVMAVCHHHSPAFMPLVATGTDYAPVFHLGAVGGIRPPYWDQHDEFGDTNMLVVRPEEGASLARALGQHPMVLMRRHGVTAVGINVQECVYRAVQTCRNADFQVRAMMIGSISSLSPGEVDLAKEITYKTTALARSWAYWEKRITERENVPASKPAARRVPARKAAMNRKAAVKKKARKTKRR